MAWNSSSIESIVLESDVVVLVMCGHDHAGGYCQINNTHFLTLPGAVEGNPPFLTLLPPPPVRCSLLAPDEMDAYAMMHVTHKEIRIEGRGTIPSQIFALDRQT